jgi:hypothetical protein
MFDEVVIAEVQFTRSLNMVLGLGWACITFDPHTPSVQSKQIRVKVQTY